MLIKHYLLKGEMPMKHTKRVIIILAIFLTPLMATDIMKITLINDISEETVSAISKISFSADSMISLNTYGIDNIKKIEFYDGEVSISSDASKKQQSNKLLKKGEIGFVVSQTNISLNLPSNSNISVAIYSLNGRNVAELFNGDANAGVLNLNISNRKLATGVYSIMVKSNSSIFARKLIIK
jgi:hypothetical protein